MTLYSRIKEMVGNDTLEVFGPSGSGKTTFAIEVVTDALSQDQTVVYIDAERNIADSPENEKLTYRYAPDLQSIVNIAANLPRADLYVLDSIGFPVVTQFALADMKRRGDMLLKCVTLTYYLKSATARYGSLALVINQPVSPFGKNRDPAELPPFGDKSIFGYKEIWRTSLDRTDERETVCSIRAWRSRRFGRGKLLFRLSITDSGVTVEEG